MLIDHLAKNLSPWEMGEQARDDEATGLDGIWTTESRHDAYVVSHGAVRTTSTLTVGTAIALAYSRTPRATATLAWEPAHASGGRFVLGLGASTRREIEDRFGMPWRAPVARMRDLILDLRSFWSAWGDGHHHDFARPVGAAPLSSLDQPSSHDHRIPVMIGATGPVMTELAGELADGVILHPMMSPQALAQVTMPALERGWERSGRDRTDFTVFLPAFVVTGSEDRRRQMRSAVLRQMTWYAARPAYRPLLEPLGLNSLPEDLTALGGGAAGQDARCEFVAEHLYDHIAIDAAPEQLSDAVLRAYGHTLDRFAAYFGWGDLSGQHLAGVLRTLRAASH